MNPVFIEMDDAQKYGLKKPEDTLVLAQGVLPADTPKASVEKFIFFKAPTSLAPLGVVEFHKVPNGKKGPETVGLKISCRKNVSRFHSAARQILAASISRLQEMKVSTIYFQMDSSVPGGTDIVEKAVQKVQDNMLDENITCNTVANPQPEGVDYKLTFSSKRARALTL